MIVMGVSGSRWWVVVVPGLLRKKVGLKWLKMA